MQQRVATGPLLDYVGQFQRWQGEDDTIFMWMDDAIFQRYVRAHLTTHGITEPTYDQRYAAVQDCRAVSYWHTITDSDVHIRLQPHLGRR